MLSFKPYEPSLDKAIMEIYSHNLKYLELSHECFSEELIIGLQEKPDKVSREHKHVEVVFFKGEPIGILDYLEHFRAKNSLYIGLLLVKNHQQGYGTQIFDALVKRYLEYEKVELGVLTNNSKGIRFWRKQGFEIFATVEYERNLKVHKMMKLF